MKLFYMLLSILIVYVVTHAEPIELFSPDNMIHVNVDLDSGIVLSAKYKNIPVIDHLQIGIELEDKLLGENPVLLKKQENTIDRILRPVVPLKCAQVRDHCNQSVLFFKHFKLWIRAYNNGMTYRFETDLDKSMTVRKEILQWSRLNEFQTFFPEETSFQSHNERVYQVLPFSDIKADSFCSLPALFQRKGINVLFTEADVYDYPCMFLQKSSALTLTGIFPPVVLETRPAEEAPDRNQVLVREADYIARIQGKRSLPWRIFMISDEDKDLVTNDLVFQLSSPLKLKDTHWIKPGKVAWDWWNALNLYGVDFESGLNTQTYKYYIDFAAEYGLEYIILDEGWSKSTTEIKESCADINIKELVEYGRSRNVGLVLWTLWEPLRKDMETILGLYSQWGIKGIKVDFMQRSDQDMVNFYEKCARLAAEHHLLVDYHGAFKPSGLRRAYPNVLNFEGLKGLEHCKWSALITTEHDLTLPFIRMAAGPMDYTPGAVFNAHPENFCARFTRPMSQGTRCHQVAMYVVYEAPLQMLCDSPSNYYREPETTGFISTIPTVWDTTVVLSAKIADYIAVARRHKNVWYVGAMTDASPRTISFDLSFLSAGTYQADIMRDGINADKNAIDYEHLEKQVTAETRMTIQMAPGGGWAGKFNRIQ